ncbi:MAG TPA: alpha-amylase family glycosyl hydrolase, partial [Geminicoccaceae bacterium]
RVDVIWQMIKDDQFRDNPPNPGFVEGMQPYHRLLPHYTADRPEILEVVAGLRRVVDEFDDRVLIGEIYLPIERLVAYYGPNLEGTHLPFNFQLILSAWEASTVAALIHEYEAALPEGGWPNWVLGNHDKSRIATRVGLAQARVAAMLLLTLRGTPTLYYGDEIGMTDVKVPPERLQDPVERRLPGLGQGRDPERTPMQWTGGPNAGFTSGEPWLPIAPDAAAVNVEAQRDDPRSMLTLHRRLILLRRSEPALSTGGYHEVRSERGVLAYVRGEGERRFLVALNLSHEAHVLALPAEGRIRLTTSLEREGEAVRGRLALAPEEGVIVEL